MTRIITLTNKKIPRQQTSSATRQLRDDYEGERLQKALGAAGYGSRRACEELIAAGRVSVNGEIAILGRRVDSENDSIAVDGAPVATRSNLVHYVLNKPSGVISSADDPQGRKVVTQYVPSDPRVYPVGRLDYDSEGLIILTNDGELTHRLTHPSFGVEKEYLVHVQGTPGPKAISTLRKGVQLEDGLTAPAKVSTLEPNVLRVTIHEGRNRQVRRMCEAVGFPVLRLVRMRIGPLKDRHLKTGEWRELSLTEVRKLFEATVAGVSKTKPKQTKFRN